MKKKIYLLFAAVTMLLAVTSCSQEEDFAQQSSNGVTSFSISLNDEVGSRTIGDGKSANKLYYEVFMEDTSVEKGSVEVNRNVTNLDLPLLNGETYNIVFWAQNEGCDIYGVNDSDGLKTISVNYENVSANQESYDAFYNALNSFKADGNTHRIELRRPFAQLNLGTSDWDQVIVDKDDQGNKKPAVTTTSVTVKGLADTFNPFTGEASASTQNEAIEATFDYSTLPEETLKVNNKDYKYLSLNYLLVPGKKDPQGTGVYVAQTNAEKAIVDLKFNLKRGDKVLQPISVPNAPLQRNWRTNIIGDVLTGTSFDIVVNPATDGDNQDIRNIDGIAELQAVMTANGDSENSVIYYVNGLSTEEDVEVNIPDNFVAKDVTFIFNNIKHGAKLTVKEVDGVAAEGRYAGKVYMQIPNLKKDENLKLASTTITLPKATIELSEGNWGYLVGASAPNTIIIGEGAIVETLEVKAGNVEVHGTVGTIKPAEGNTQTIIVTLSENANVTTIEESIIVRTDVAPEGNETEYFAQVGEYYYKSLADAVKGIAETGEIKILKDYSYQGSVTVPTGKNITLDLNNCTVSGTSTVTGQNYDMIDVRGTLTVKNGTLTAKFNGENMGWNNSTNVFNITAGGVVNLESVTAQNLGGSDMAFVAHLNNWGEATLNVENSTLESTYIAVRAFNSGNDMNNITIKNSTLKGKYCFWVHNYKAAGDANGTDATLNLDILNGTNTFEYSNKALEVGYPILYGFNKAVYINEEGIGVNEDGDHFIYNAVGMKWIANVVNNTTPYTATLFDNKNIYLMNNIDLNNEEWIPIGDDRSQRTEFHGIFDGQGYAIKNVKITKKTDRDDDNKSSYGLFGNLKGIVKNLTVENVSISGAPKFIGALVGRLNDGLVENCHVKNSSVECENWTIGGIVGQYNNGKISGCSIENSTIKGYGAVGAITGIVLGEGERTIENCSVKNCTLVQNGSFGGDYDKMFGVVLGAVYNGKLNVTLTGCTIENTTIKGKESNEQCGFISEGDKLAIDGYEYVANGVFKKDVEYNVSNADGLAYMNTIFVNKTAGRDVVLNLTADIDFTGKTWTPVDSHADTKFEIAEINGKGHTISNLTINGQAMFTRFAGLGDVTIKDITFDNATVNSNGKINTSILTVQSYQNVLLDNVDVKNSSITGGYKVAPLIATVYNESPNTIITATLKNCDVENTTVKATTYDFCTTGMVAFVNASDKDQIVFENCTVKEVKLYAPNDSYKAHASIYTIGGDSDELFNEAEGVTVTNVTFQANN